ncbi:hypothetical protein M1146_06005 [Patescibacteria group bacterium]|nr:hypothetical protein [Patescibacteria group bacterium]
MNLSDLINQYQETQEQILNQKAFSDAQRQAYVAQAHQTLIDQMNQAQLQSSGNAFGTSGGGGGGGVWPGLVSAATYLSGLGYSDITPEGPSTAVGHKCPWCGRTFSEEKQEEAKEHFATHAKTDAPPGANEELWKMLETASKT